VSGATFLHNGAVSIHGTDAYRGATEIRTAPDAAAIVATFKG